MQVAYDANVDRVILFDVNRNLLVKLDGDECSWGSVDEASGAPPQHWHPLGKGQWSDDHFSDARP